MEQSGKKNAAEEMVLRQGLAKLVEADDNLKANETQIVSDIATMRETVTELERQRAELLPTSTSLTADMAELTKGETVLQRQLNRNEADRTIAQKKAVDRAIMDLKLRVNEINDAVAQLEKALAQVRSSRATLALHMGKLKDIIGDDRASGYSSL